MDPMEPLLDRLTDSLTAFLARFADLFVHDSPREQLGKYVRGLLVSILHKNGWQLAEAAGDARPDRMQRLLYSARWDADLARDRQRAYVAEALGDPEGIGIVDETGFLKQGTYSVGVKRQYSGTAGRTENCQIGTFLAYATPRGQTLIDRRLYLPEEWCTDTERRTHAKVPETVTFQTKPQQALAMLQAAWAAGVPMRWVAGDAVYGDAQYFRAAIQAAGRWYVLGVSSITPVWTEYPPLRLPRTDTGGRPQTRKRLADVDASWVTVAAAVAALPPSRWHRLSVRDGEKGPITYDWARLRVYERVNGLPGKRLWLLARRSVTNPTEVKYFLSNAPRTVTLPTLARVASTRFAVEQCFKEAKGQNGLDQYEVRRWQSWHRHITLAMMAHAWLTVTRAEEAERELAEAAAHAQKGGPASDGAPHSARSAARDRDCHLAGTPEDAFSPLVILPPPETVGSAGELLSASR
jgi:SRSO17 transposase